MQIQGGRKRGYFPYNELKSSKGEMNYVFW